MKYIRKINPDTPLYKTIALMLKLHMEQRPDGLWRYKQGWTDQILAEEVSQIVPADKFDVGSVRYATYGPSRLFLRKAPAPEQADVPQLALEPLPVAFETDELLRDILGAIRRTNALLSKLVEPDEVQPVATPLHQAALFECAHGEKQ